MMFQKNDKGESPKAGSGATIIASGTVFTGNIHSSHDIRIDGHVIGNIECSSKIVIGPGGEVEGNLQCSQCDVLGRIVGDIEATESLILRDKARVEGNIYARMLQMEAGVAFNGQCRMGSVSAKEEVASPVKPRTEKMKLQHAV